MAFLDRKGGFLFPERWLFHFGTAALFARIMHLMLRPEQGALIRGTGGLRKIRWAGTGRGKRGGLRLIYYWAMESETIYMLYAYAKSKQEDLTPEQCRVLSRIVREEFK